MPIANTLIEIAPALERGVESTNATEIKRMDQVNQLIRLVVVGAGTLLVATGVLPADTNLDTWVMALSGVYVAASTLWSMVSAVLSTAKLGLTRTSPP